MTKSLAKVNLASLKVLNTLQLLFAKDLSMEELIKSYELYHNENCSNFLMSKYINTCRYCGIDIKKINNKYTVLNLPIGLNFSGNELSLFQELKNCCERVKIDQLSDSMQKFLNKINRRAERPISPVATSAIHDQNIKTFEKSCIQKQKVKLVFTDGTSKICEPVDITIGRDKIILTIFDGQASHELSPDDIEVVKMLPQKSKSMYMPTTVLYELKGKLGKKYQIRDHEHILKMSRNGDIVITNRFEDKTKLLHRLMRYGDNCKLISPKSYVEDMKKMIEETIKNYEG